MIDTICGYIQIYLNRPTVVFMDILLLTLATASIVSVFFLRRKINDLSVAISLLRMKIEKKG